MFKKLTLSIVVAAAALSGCATSGSKYSCPHPNGVTCMAATDVYRATNNADEVVGIDPKEAAKAAREGRSAGKVVSPGPASEGKEIEVPVPGAVPVSGSSAQVRARPQLNVAVEGDTLALTDTSLQQAAGMRRAAYTPAQQEPYTTLPQVDVTSEPYRVPAKIMRIYIKPWEDEAGDLHMGGYIFSEVETRKWTQTNHALKADARVFQLMEAPKKDAAQEAAPSGNAVATPSNPPQGVVANHNQPKGSTQ